MAPCFTLKMYVKNPCHGNHQHEKRGVDVAVEVLEISVLAREADPKGGGGEGCFTLEKKPRTGVSFGYMGVSKNNGTPKSSILIGFCIINHPFWGTPLFLETPIYEGVDHSIQ